MTKLTIVVAMNRESVIGADNKLPWHIPEDLQYFKQVTYGKPVIMGRKTYDSIGRLLPGRRNIIVSRNRDLVITGADIYDTLENAINANKDVLEICIIGGGEIFKQALPLVDELHLTIIDYPVDDGNVFFPKLDMSKWKLIKTNSIISANNIKCEFNVYCKEDIG